MRSDARPFFFYRVVGSVYTWGRALGSAASLVEERCVLLY